MRTKNLLVLKKTAVALAVIWTVLIAIMCLLRFDKLPSIGVSEEDKYVHFTFHFVFTMLWGFYSWQKENSIVVNKIVSIVFISLCYGIVIEVLQETCTTTRHADLFDVIANATGAISAFALFVLLKISKNKLDKR